MLGKMDNKKRQNPVLVCVREGGGERESGGGLLCVTMSPHPLQVTRHISAMVNVQDDYGVLVGNWSGNYDGGTSPLDWSGSAEILAQFNRRKQPVKFAQCWVFSGVETTC